MSAAGEASGLSERLGGLPPKLNVRLRFRRGAYSEPRDRKTVMLVERPRRHVPLKRVQLELSRRMFSRLLEQRASNALSLE